jgi:hypothetical protein
VVEKPLRIILNAELSRISFREPSPIAAVLWNGEGGVAGMAPLRSLSSSELEELAGQINPSWPSDGGPNHIRRFPCPLARRAGAAASHYT